MNHSRSTIGPSRAGANRSKVKVGVLGVPIRRGTRPTTNGLEHLRFEARCVTIELAGFELRPWFAYEALLGTLRLGDEQRGPR
jgi:hypothetical protein